MKKLTDKQRQELERVKAIPDARIDLSDMPEIKDMSGGVRGRFYRSETRAISIRLSEADLDQARVIAQKKGLSYQTYIKSVLHEAIERDRAHQ